MPKDSSEPSYLVVNADESEPGTFKDRLLMEKDPHLCLEGFLISAYAIRASIRQPRNRLSKQSQSSTRWKTAGGRPSH